MAVKKEPVVIAVDCMGGDHAPESVIGGLKIVCKKLEGKVKFLLFGNKDLISIALKTAPDLKDTIVEIRHTPSSISGDMPVVRAMRIKDSSMRLAIEAVNSGEASGVVSSGNTGAYLSLSRYILKTIPGISRPAIISPFPTARGESVMLDLGANISCDANNIVDFAVMGSVFAKLVLGKDNPSIGILNVGTEEQKGYGYLHDASEILKERGLNVHGFIEGDDVTKGTVDVIVTDGFTGNVSLKMAEGMVKLILGIIKHEVKSSILCRIAALFLLPAINRLKHKFDPSRYNGALWLGLNGIAVKSHGGADERAFAFAVETTYNMIVQNMNKRIAEEIAKFSEI